MEISTEKVIRRWNKLCMDMSLEGWSITAFVMISELNEIILQGDRVVIRTNEDILRCVLRDDKIKTLQVSSKLAKILDRFIDVFRNLVHLKTIDFTDLVNSSKCYTKLPTVLLDNTSITKIVLTRCVIAYPELKLVSDALAKNRTVKELILEDTDIGRKEIEALSYVLEGRSSIEILNMNGNHFGNNDYKVLAETLKKNKTMKEIYFEIEAGWATLDISVAKSLAECIDATDSPFEVFHILNTNYNGTTFAYETVLLNASLRNYRLKTCIYGCDRDDKFCEYIKRNRKAEKRMCATATAIAWCCSNIQLSMLPDLLYPIVERYSQSHDKVWCLKKHELSSFCH